MPQKIIDPLDFPVKNRSDRDRNHPNQAQPWRGEKGTCAMDRTTMQVSPTPTPITRRPVFLILIVVAVAGILWAAWGSRRRGRDRPELVTLYRNARPGVRYVGDAACTRCHSEIAATYRQH